MVTEKIIKRTFQLTPDLKVILDFKITKTPEGLVKAELISERKAFPIGHFTQVKNSFVWDKSHGLKIWNQLK